MLQQLNFFKKSNRICFGNVATFSKRLIDYALMTLLFKVMMPSSDQDVIGKEIPN